MIKKVYYWKELTSDGLLKEPEKAGPYYNQDYLNDGGFENELEAMERLEYFCKVHQPDYSNLTLIPIYEVRL